VVKRFDKCDACFLKVCVGQTTTAAGGESHLNKARSNISTVGHRLLPGWPANPENIKDISTFSHFNFQTFKFRLLTFRSLCQHGLFGLVEES